MAKRQNSRRQYLTLQALEPLTGELSAEVQISYGRMQTVGKRSLGQAKECGFIVPAILQRPLAVFEGIRQEEDEDPKGVGWRCYCGIPEHSYRPDGTAAAPYRNQVFLVFVNEEAVAYHWRWGKADSEDPRLPLGYATRFKRQIYGGHEST